MTGRVGLLGGTFDPPHLAHLVVAECARVSLGLDEVRLLVAGDPWMKTRISPAADRVAMARAAVAEDPSLRVDDRETRRDGPTYTAETLEQLTDEEPGVSWFFLIGADAVMRLPEWHRVEDALALATFVAVTRAGYDLRLEQHVHARVETLEVPHLDISSTDLRHRVATGRAVRYLVPPPVFDHIARRGLYRS